MDHFETWLTTDGGLTLFSQGWLPGNASPRGTVLLVHGFGEHSGRYERVVEFLTSHGLAVQSLDLRGHGRSGGARGHTASYEDLMDDIGLLFADSERRWPGSSRFLYGHSMGGQLVLNYTLRRKPRIKGAVATSPALRTSVDGPPIKGRLVGLLGSVLPGMTVPAGLDVSGIARDPDVVAAYVNDPLVHGRISLGLAKGLFESTNWLYAHAREFDVPILLTHGTGDRLAYSDATERLAALVPSECTLRLWDGLYHELHHEPEKDQVLAFILAWIDEQLTA